MPDNKVKSNTEEVNEVEEETQDVESSPEPPQQANPREVLFQIFEQGARASDDWEKSQLRIQCLLALQQTSSLVDIPRELRMEISFVMNELLKAGQLNFGLQQILYPMVRELE